MPCIQLGVSGSWQLWASTSWFWTYRLGFMPRRWTLAGWYHLRAMGWYKGWCFFLGHGWNGSSKNVTGKGLTRSGDRCWCSWGTIQWDMIHRYDQFKYGHNWIRLRTPYFFCFYQCSILLQCVVFHLSPLKAFEALFVDPLLPSMAISGT